MPRSRPSRTIEGEFPLPLSGLQHADKLVDDLRAALGALLELSGVRYDDINADSPSVVVLGWNKWQWTALPDEAAPLVGAARQALSRLGEFSGAAARAAADRLAELRKLELAFERLVEQPSGSFPSGAPERTIDAVQGHAEATLAQWALIVRRLPSAYGSNERLLVVDTSALLDRPDLQDWRLDDEAWTVVLLPQVLSEIDDKKRDPRTRDAAQKVIRQLEEFERRGDTLDGVPMSGKLTVREVPTSPDMSRTLSWLRPDVPDDLIIAGALELRWHDLTSRIAVAASDRNVRNKARLAGLGRVQPERL